MRAERKERLDMVVRLNAVRPSGGSMVQRLRMLLSECDSEIAEIEQGIAEACQALKQIHKKIFLASNGLDNRNVHGEQTPGSVHGHRARGGEVLGDMAPGATDHKGGAVLDVQAPRATANNGMLCLPHRPMSPMLTISWPQEWLMAPTTNLSTVQEWRLSPTMNLLTTLHPLARL
jgi:hypothetical protein